MGLGQGVSPSSRCFGQLPPLQPRGVVLWEPDFGPQILPLTWLALAWVGKGDVVLTLVSFPHLSSGLSREAPPGAAGSWSLCHAQTHLLSLSLSFSAKQLRWLNCDRFSPGPEAAEGPGSPEGARHPVLVAALGPQENPGAAFLPRRVERDIGPAGMCCTRGCTRKEMMPFC